MSDDPRQLIIKILQAINYEGDRDKYADDFLSLCLQQAIIDLLPDLSPEDQKKFTETIFQISAVDELASILLEYFPKEKYENAIKEASRKTFDDYLKTIIPNLNQDQINSLKQYLSQPASDLAI